MRIASALALIATVTFVAACPDSAPGFCERSINCDPDTDDGSDEAAAAIDSCVEVQRDFFADLRAAGDADCTALADAFEAQSRCFAALDDCNEFNEPNNGTCVDEGEAVAAACDAVVDASCADTAAPSCGIGDGA